MAYFIGLMSGTSLDGIDAALVDDNMQLIASHWQAYPEQIKLRIAKLCQAGENEIHQQMQLNYDLAVQYAQAVNALLKQSDLQANSIAAIGCHGQTIRHQVIDKPYYSLQLGCAETLSFQTGIKVVSQFRQADIAAGGQGAPLAPLLHKYLFAKPDENIAIVNIGGIANLTAIGASGQVIGFDCGPGNCLLDDWAQLHLTKDYDDGGCWALSGQVNSVLVNQLLDDCYFSQPYPKSLDRYYFNLDYINSYIKPDDKPQDVQASLVEFTALAIKSALTLSQLVYKQVLLCGGGVHNQALMQALIRQIPHCAVTSTLDVGVDPDYLEAILMAYLAQQCLLNCPSDTPPITGAKRATILGTITHP